MFRTWYSNGMPDLCEYCGKQHSWEVQIGLYARDLPTATTAVPSPAEAVTERIEARRVALQARHGEAPASSTCDGWGLVLILASDGAGYDRAACLGCPECAPPAPSTRMHRVFEAMARDVADEEPM